MGFLNEVFMVDEILFFSRFPRSLPLPDKKEQLVFEQAAKIDKIFWLLFMFASEKIPKVAR